MDKLFGFSGGNDEEAGAPPGFLQRYQNKRDGVRGLLTM